MILQRFVSSRRTIYEMIIGHPIWQNRNFVILILLEFLNLGVIWFIWLKKIEAKIPAFGFTTTRPFLNFELKIFIPFIISVFFLVNFLLALYAFRKEILGSYFLILAVLISQIFVYILSYYYMYIAP